MKARLHIRVIAAANTPHPLPYISRSKGPVGLDKPCEGPRCSVGGSGKCHAIQCVTLRIGPDGTDGLEMRSNTRARPRYGGSGVNGSVHALPCISVPSVPSGPDPPIFVRSFSRLRCRCSSSFRTLLSVSQSLRSLEDIRKRQHLGEIANRGTKP